MNNVTPNKDPRRTGYHQARRRRLAATLPQPCGICGRWVQPGDEWDVDHVRPVVLGGAMGEVRVAHRSCNREQGLTLLKALRSFTARPSRQW